MINFFLVDDPGQHICEVQIVHTKMMVARQGLPGHAIYNRTRNAMEILERMGAANPEKRAKRVFELRTEGVAAKALLELGYGAVDLMKAGYTDAEVDDAGVGAEVLARAREQHAAARLEEEESRRKAARRASRSIGGGLKRILIGGAALVADAGHEDRNRTCRPPSP